MKNPGCHHGFLSVLGCRPCVTMAAVQRKGSPCRGCQSPGGGSQCGRGSPTSRWSAGRRSRGSSSRRIRMRECPLFNVSQTQWVSWENRNKTGERHEERNRGDGRRRKPQRCYSPRSESVGRRGWADMELPTLPVLPCRDRTCLMVRFSLKKTHYCSVIAHMICIFWAPSADEW